MSTIGKAEHLLRQAIARLNVGNDRDLPKFEFSNELEYEDVTRTYWDFAQPVITVNADYVAELDEEEVFYLVSREYKLAKKRDRSKDLLQLNPSWVNPKPKTRKGNGHHI